MRISSVWMICLLFLRTRPSLSMIFHMDRQPSSDAVSRNWSSNVITIWRHKVRWSKLFSHNGWHNSFMAMTLCMGTPDTPKVYKYNCMYCMYNSMSFCFSGNLEDPHEPTLEMEPQWAWYTIHSFWMGNGYLMALMVPLEVPVNMTLPEWETATAVWATSSAGTSLRICGTRRSLKSIHHDWQIFIFHI